MPDEPYRSASDPFLARQISDLQTVAKQTLSAVESLKGAVSNLADRTISTETKVDKVLEFAADDDRRIKVIEARPAFSWLRVGAVSMALILFGGAAALAAQAVIR